MTLKKSSALGEGHNAIFDSDFVLDRAFLSIEFLDYELKKPKRLDARIARLTGVIARKANKQVLRSERR